MYRRTTPADSECTIIDDGQKGETYSVPIKGCIDGNKYNSK
jgi:hypothetical protein